jgi:hypothetical protein
MRRLAYLACVLVTVCGCAGTETGNPPSARHVSLALLLQSTNSDLVKVGSSELDDGALRVDSAWVATNFLELLGCVGLDELELGAMPWDLLHPVARGLDTELASFCGTRLETLVADAGLGAVPPGFLGASLWVTGTRAGGTPVVVRSTAALSLSSQNASQPLDASRLVLTFDAAAWFSGVSVSALSPDSDGIVRLSPTSNPLLLQAVEGRAGDGATLRAERSDDGVLDD